MVQCKWLSKQVSHKLGFLAALTLLGAALPVAAASDQIIFDNSTNDLVARFNPGTTEVGDQIVLDGTARYLTDFRFEYWGVNALSPGGPSFDGSVQARVRFYLNDGTPFNGYATPGTQFYDSGWFSLDPTDRSTLVFLQGTDFPYGGLLMPLSGVPGDEMTWTVQFQGMTANDSVGVDLYAPPNIGGDYPDYWENTISGWVLKTNVVTMDFGARMEANVIPEPSSATLFLLGGLGVFAFARLFRRR